MLSRYSNTDGGFGTFNAPGGGISLPKKYLKFDLIFSKLPCKIPLWKRIVRSAGKVPNKRKVNR